MSKLPALVVTVTGVAVTLALYLWIYKLQAQGLSPGALSMPDMDMKDMHIYWSFPILQASGLSGILFAYISLLLGLQQHTRSIPGIRLNPLSIDCYHRYVSLLVICLVIIHIIATAYDAMGDNWRTVLVPGKWGLRTWVAGETGYNIGITAFYLLMLLAPTFYIRNFFSIGQWKFLHRFVLVFYILSIWHALMLGVDIEYHPWIRPVIWLLQIPLLYLLIKRLQQAINKQQAKTAHERRRLVILSCKALWLISMLAIIAIVILVVTGQSGFIKTV